jgi:hypothetical protein
VPNLYLFSRSVQSALLVFVLSVLAQGQTQQSSLVTSPIDDRVRITLKGNVHPLALPRYDQGAVPDSFPAERMLLLLQRPRERETALRQFLQDVHRAGSPSYQKWLSPKQFGEVYGPDDSDVAAAEGWLQKHGFSVARITRGKTAIEFSGTAGQVRETFHTEIHTYLVNGEQHHANNSDPQIPAALLPVVAGITPINDFRPKSYIQVLGRALYDRSTHLMSPQWTQSSFSLALAPGDFAVQYDLTPIYSGGTNGSGVTIGIIGSSNVDPTLVAAYRSLFGLPALAFNVVIDGNDPGETYAAIESYLDVEVSGAVAPGAAINLYTSANTMVQAGLELAAQRAVDDDEASVLSTSYGQCEQNLGSGGNLFWAGVWEQAAAQGQSSFVSAGDGGSAGCDDFDDAESAQYGLAVNGISSTPWNISVGGTDFFYSSYDGGQAAQNAQMATYWNLTPTNLPTVSLLKPVPEQPWNRPFGLNLSTGGIGTQSGGIIAGSGGASSCTTGADGSNGTYTSCTAGYPKPSWQSGSGVPADGVRDVPDISLFAADNENYSSYPICVEVGECVPSNGDVGVFAVGGTSASSPSMAGIMALINQKFGPQGQADFIFYSLAAQHPTIFHDIAIGGNNVPCEQGTPDCTLSVLSNNTDGLYTLGHYYSTAGYDQATGLGSIDADLLLNNWNSLTFTPTTTSLNLGQTTFTHGTPVSVSVAVAGAGGTPSGEVALVTTASPRVNTGLSELSLQGGNSTATMNSLPGGQYKITARYGGDNVFAPSTSTPVSVNVSPEGSTLSVFGSYLSYGSNAYLPVSNGGSYPYATFIAIDTQLHEASAPQGALDGVATGTVTFTDAASIGTAGSGSLNINSQGVAEWVPTAAFALGTHSLSAAYSGDVSFNASSSTVPLNFTITKGVPAVTLSANPTVVGLGSSTALTLVVAIASPIAATPPTGTVTFHYGNSVLGTAALTNPNGQGPIASINVSSLPLGNDLVTASYSGDSNYEAATSAPINVSVLEPSNLTASANPTSINITGSTVVTATVPGVSGLPAPTGYVSFGTSNYLCGANNLVNGSASCTFSGNSLSVGSDAIGVGYSGDTNYAPASVNVLVNETIPFTLSVTPVVIAAPGATTGNTSTVTVAPQNGFTGSVSLACALTSSPTGAQELPTCAVPSSVKVTGTGSVTATMTINSTAAATAAAIHSGWEDRRWYAATACMVMAGLFVLGMPAGHLGRRRLISLLTIGLVALLVGCGGGNSGGGGGTTVTGTTPGTYTFTVQGSYASAAASQIATVTVTIQ